MADVTVSVLDNGPLIVKGDVSLADGDGNTYPPSSSPIALCRCGASGNRPFCDGAHVKAGFAAAERAPAE